MALPLTPPLPNQMEFEQTLGQLQMVRERCPALSLPRQAGCEGKSACSLSPIRRQGHIVRPPFPLPAGLCLRCAPYRRS
jgi:hypothetical protein